MELEEVLEIIRNKNDGGIWESFVRVEYGYEWLKASWDAFKDLSVDCWDYYTEEEIIYNFIQMVNDEMFR